MDFTKSCAIVGAGGHGLVVGEIAELNGFSTHFFDDKDGFPDVNDVVRENFSTIFIAIGDPIARRNITLQLGGPGVKLIHPFSSISHSSSIGMGTVIMSLVAVTAGTSIGDSCILNTSCSVDHECVLDDYVHICPGAHIAGGVTIRRGSWIGIGASVREGLTIGSNVVVGAGSAVVSNIANDSVVAGTPARSIHLNYNRLKSIIKNAPFVWSK